jgi:hypothetical protein
MKNRATIILLLLFTALLGALWYAQRAEIRSQRQAEFELQYIFPDLLNVPAGNVLKVEVDRLEGDPIIAERREGGQWQLVKPFDTAADRDLIETLIANMKGARKSQEAGTIEGALATFGLDKPAATVAITLKGSDKRLGFEVGKTLKNRLYIRAGEPKAIEVVDTRLFGAVTKPPSDWRDTKLFRASSFQVAEVEVTRKAPAETISLKRTESHWQMTEPIKAPADDDKAEGLIAELAALRVLDPVKDFVQNDVKDEKARAKFGLDAPSMTITVKPFAGKGPAQSLSFGATVPGTANEVYALRGDQDDVVKLDVKRLREAIPSANALRSQKVLDFHPGRVRRIEIEHAGKRFDISLASGRWALTAPVEQTADTAALQTMLTSLDKLRASEFLSPASASDPRVDPPSFRIKLWERARVSPEEARSGTEPKLILQADLTLGRHDLARKTVFGRIEGDPTVLAIPDEILKVLPSDAFAFRERTILKISPEKFAKITVEHRDQSITVTPPGIGSVKDLKSRMIAPVEGSADDGAVSALAYTLGNLRAEGWASDTVGDGKAFGLDAPWLRVKWYLQEGGEKAKSGPSSSLPPGVMRVGKIKPGGQYFANIEGDPKVFLLNAGTVAPLEAELRDRSIFTFRPESVERLTLEWLGRSLAFRRTQTSPIAPIFWEPETGFDPAGFDPAIIPALLKTLSSLATPRYLQYDGPIQEIAGLNSPRLSIALQLSGEKTEKTLRIGSSRPDGSYFATTARGTQGPLFMLPSDPVWKAILTPPARAGDLPADVFAPDSPKGKSGP